VAGVASQRRKPLAIKWTTQDVIKKIQEAIASPEAGQKGGALQAILNRGKQKIKQQGEALGNRY